MAYVQEAVVGALLAAIYDHRAPKDDDLLDCVQKLRQQMRTN